MEPQTFFVGVKAIVADQAGKILLVHIPAWGGNPEHWDMPGGRLDAGEDFHTALHRELREEVGVTGDVETRQLATAMVQMTIPSRQGRLPLVNVVYRVVLPADSRIRLDPDSPEDQYGWFDPTEAAVALAVKYDADFCRIVATLA